MATDPNEAGKIRVANVTLTEAVAFDPAHDDANAPETWKKIAANDFDPVAHKDMHFFCPCCLDNDDQVRLKKPAAQRIQSLPFDVIDPRTNEPVLDANEEPVLEYRRYLFPAHFSTWDKQTHSCDLVQQQHRLSQSLTDMGGITPNKDDGVTIINLGIPAGQAAEAHRRRPYVHLSTESGFNGAADGETTRRLHTSTRKPSRKLSHGASSVDDLAELLDHTEFDRGKREAIALRNGNQMVSLEQLYHENTLDMYRELFVREKKIMSDPDANHNHLALFRFRPNGNRKFWHRENDGSMTVESHPEQIRDKDGHLFYVSAHVNFQTESAFQAFEKSLKDGETSDDRWFLAYTEHANVDPFDYAHKKAEMEKGNAKSATVHTSATVFNKGQMIQWVPQDPQMEIDFDTKFERSAPPPSENDDLTL
tara:strand:+ start:363 stop:1628 length:1266 start_codon:yes stop_codon:yes gene_type:complete